MTPGAERASESRLEWPTRVFDAPVLRGLDERARREIRDAGRLVSLRPGEVLYREGDGGEAFFVVAEGRVGLSAIRRGDERATDLREAGPGDSLGEEATVGASRRTTATAVDAALAAEVPVHVFRRAAARSGRAEVAEKLERALRRAATRDLLRAAALTRDLDESRFDMLLDAARVSQIPRGQTVYRQGDPSTELWLVGDGLVQIQTIDDDDRLHVRAYLGKGDFFGDVELDRGAPRTATAVAAGPSVLIAIPVDVVEHLSEADAELLPRLRRVSADQSALQAELVGRAAKHATAHAFRDLYRLQVAKSLLVIDLDHCVRCGHCAWACAELHGVSRLVRRGDKIVARVEDAPTTATRSGVRAEPVNIFDLEAPRTLMLPNSCQHCENPSCMVDCPTGAIGREPDGEVFIRPELCTGCAACAKACPWENIQMAERPASAPKPEGADAEDLAVKCELCREYERGPACVQVCPTSAIFRMNPAEELPDVRRLLEVPRSEGATHRGPPGVAPVLPWVGGAAIAALGLGGVGMTMQARGLWDPSHGVAYAAGILAACGFVGLLAYAMPKRGVRLWMKRSKAHAGPVRRSVVRGQAGLHFALGLVTLGLAAAHVPWPLTARPGTGAALAIAWLVAGLSGLWMGLAYALVPPRLAKIERTAALPEDLSADRRVLVDRLYQEVSGRSELVKKIFERILLPYVQRPLGSLALLVSGRSLRDEQREVRKRVDVVLEGRGADRLAGLEELVRLVVELRAVPAQRWLLRILRVGLPLHVVSFVFAMVLLVLHIVAVS